MRIIPAIDIFEGRCVRLTGGIFDSRTQYPPEPASAARAFERSGARYLHVVDLEGAKEGRVVNWGSLERIRESTGAIVKVGGGVRTETEVYRLLGLGFDRVIVGSIALESPQLLAGWVARFGAEKFCIALDVKDGRLASAGWQHLHGSTIRHIVPQLAGLGLKLFLSTDIRRDGTLAGPNLPLYSSLVREFPDREWLASGGVRSVEDVAALARAGLAGVVIGKALYEGTVRLEDLKEYTC